MQINISGQEIEITPALRGHVQEKFQRLERHFPDALEAHVVLREESPILKKAEATVHVAGHTLFAHAEEKDLYAAIDRMVDKLDHQLLKIKEKQLPNKKHKRNGKAGL